MPSDACLEPSPLPLPDLPPPERPAGFDAGFDPDRRRAACALAARRLVGRRVVALGLGGLLLGRRVDAVVHLPGSGRSRSPAASAAPAAAPALARSAGRRRGAFLRSGRVGRLGRAGSIVGVGSVASASRTRAVTGRSVNSSSVGRRRPTSSRSAGLVPPPRPRPPRRRRLAPLDEVLSPPPSAGSSADAAPASGASSGRSAFGFGAGRARGGRGGWVPRAPTVPRASSVFEWRPSGSRPSVRCSPSSARARRLRQGCSPLEGGDALVDLGNGRRLRRGDLGLVIHCYSSRSGREGAPVPARTSRPHPRATRAMCSVSVMFGARAATDAARRASREIAHP